MVNSPAQRHPGTASTLSVEQKQEIFLSLWNAVNEHFYDPDFRGAPWQEMKSQYSRKFVEAKTREQIRALVREFLGKLNNSHVMFFTREELTLRKNILPFFFKQ